MKGETRKSRKMRQAKHLRRLGKKQSHSIPKAFVMAMISAQGATKD